MAQKTILKKVFSLKSKIVMKYLCKIEKIKLTSEVNKFIIIILKMEFINDLNQ